MKCGITCKPTQQRKATEKKNSIAELKVRCGLKKLCSFVYIKLTEKEMQFQPIHTHTDIHTTVQTQITVNNNGAVIVLSTKYKRSITFIFGFYGEICIIINLVVRCRLVGCRTLSYSHRPANVLQIQTLSTHSQALSIQMHLPARIQMSPKSHKILLASPLETICVQHFGIKFSEICV